MSPMFNYQIQYERLREALEELWNITTDSSITEENKVKIIRDVSRATLDGEPTTADEYNSDEITELVKNYPNDMQLGNKVRTLANIDLKEYVINNSQNKE